MTSCGSMLNPYASPWEPPSAKAMGCRGLLLDSNAVAWFLPSSGDAGNGHLGTYNLWAGSGAPSSYQRAAEHYKASWSLFAASPFQPFQEQIGFDYLAVQSEQSQESWENSQWLQRRPCSKGLATGATPDAEVSSTASGSAASLEDADSDLDASTPSPEAIDSLTLVPCDLFDRLVRAGNAARMRGQHKRVRSPGGTTRLRSTDAMLFGQFPAGAPPPPPPSRVARRLGPCPAGVPPPPPFDAGL